VTISEDSAESRMVNLQTEEFRELIFGWYDFLLAYENEEIPGIIYPNKKKV